MQSLIQIGKIQSEIERLKKEFETWLISAMHEAQKKIDEVSKMQRGERGMVGGRGEKGERGGDGPKGDAGERGPVGPRGETPIAGIDFPLPKDGIDGKDASPEEVLNYIRKLPKGKKLKIADTDMLQEVLDALSRQMSERKFGGEMRGGGDTVAAGSGISISRSSNGVTTISSSAGSVVENEIIAGSGTTFTLANTPVAGSVKLYAARNRIYPTTDWTISGAVITTVLSWSAGDLIADYRR